MKVFITDSDKSNKFLEATSGGIAKRVYIDCQEFPDALVGYLSQVLVDQGLVPVMKVRSALASKRQYGGLAIIYGEKKIMKSQLDAKTLWILAEKDNANIDKAVESCLEFFKKFKLQSPL